MVDLTGVRGRHVFALLLRGAAILGLLALTVPTAGAMVGGTSQFGAGFAAPIAYIEIATPGGDDACTGTLISPTVVMTAAHCLFDTNASHSFLRIARPSEISVRIGSLNVSDATLGFAAGVVAVLPQPRYRWDGTRHAHDIALLALDRAAPQAPAALAEQRPGAGKALLIAGYGRTSTSDDSPAAALRVGRIDAARPASCRLVSEAFDPSWLFCGAASAGTAAPGGTACYGDSGGPAFASENTLANLVVEGVISYGSRAQCELSHSYLVLVSSERGFIDRALATPPQGWGRLRDDPPSATVRPIRMRVGETGVVAVRIADDRSSRARVEIGFYTRGGERLSHAYRTVATNRWVRFKLAPQLQRFSGLVCAQGTDGTSKPSNVACAADIVR
jgi:Trypsin